MNEQQRDHLGHRQNSADPKQKKPVPLLRWTEDRLTVMMNEALPASVAKRVDYEAMSSLFIMAYDGFVINRRLNDLRDIERLADAVCDMVLGARAA